MKKIHIITVAKVGSASIYHSLIKKKGTDAYHGHSLDTLKNVLKTSDNLIITGIRNPLDRNLSYLFQTMGDKFFNDVKTSHNNYKGEYCYLQGYKDSNDLIDKYFKMDYHNTFNEWFNEFLEITNIKKFNKEKGFEIYCLDNNNKILMYTLEKLNLNEIEICDYLDIDTLIKKNINEDDLYKRVKKKISYKKEYLDNLLNTDIMRLFYTNEDIKEMYT